MLEALQAQVFAPTFDCVVSFNSFINTCRQCALVDDSSINLVIAALTRDKKILVDFVDNAKDVKVSVSAEYVFVCDRVCLQVVKFIAPGTSVVRPLTEIENSVFL